MDESGIGYYCNTALSSLLELEDVADGMYQADLDTYTANRQADQVFQGSLLEIRSQITKSSIITCAVGFSNYLALVIRLYIEALV